MSAVGGASGSDEPVALRFIPFSRADLLGMLRAESMLGDSELEQFEGGAAAISAAFRDEFHTIRQSIKSHYAPLDPDADTRRLSQELLSETEQAEALSEHLATLLNRANYELLTDEHLRKAFRSASLFRIRLQVDLEQFDDVLLYCRGAQERSETLTSLFGLWKRKVQFTNYQRVVLFLRFADRGQPADSEYPPGRVMIKLFQNVPDADLEMLFPNSRVSMRWIDRLLIGVPAVASGAVVAATKLGTPLLLLGTLFGFWLGLHSEPVTLDKRGLIAIAAGFGALAAYSWKQWSSYRRRKARFRQALTRNLYFKLLDNNAGVLLRVLDDAEDSECKEAFAALYFLLAVPEGLSSESLDARIEQWLLDRHAVRVNFEIADALGKLARLGLAREQGGVWQAVSGEVATAGKTQA